MKRDSCAGGAEIGSFASFASFGLSGVRIARYLSRITQHASRLMPSEASDATGTSPGFQPHIPPGATMPECTPRAIILGTLLGMVFGASSLYLVLKVGLTVSASIPVAVISLALFRLWSKAGGRDATILENNIVQTAGSAGESIAFGLGVTMPAIMILGFDLEIGRVMLVGLLGSLLGILMMIPLRRALIVAQHGQLKYPEGTACAQVLKAGAAHPAGSGIKASTIFTGFGIGLAYKTLMAAFKLWKDVPEKIFGAPLKGGSISAEISPELLGVGYIIGPRIASIMMAGGVLSCLVLTPLIKFFGEGLNVVLPAGHQAHRRHEPGRHPQRLHPLHRRRRGRRRRHHQPAALAAHHPQQRPLRAVRFQSRRRRPHLGPPHRARPVHEIRRGRHPGSHPGHPRGALAHMNLLGAMLIVVFGFLFVTVSSRLTGEIGSSSNPISGMTVATLLLTCLVFLIVGWTGGTYYVTALSVGGIVCVAASNAGATSQDLKTGFLVGATPKYQQISILIGAAVSALLLGPILLGLNQTATVYVPAAQVAPGLHVPADAKPGRA